MAELIFVPVDDDEANEWMSFLHAEKKKQSQVAEGGEGSGNFGHAGRPGQVGGSAPDDAGAPGQSGKRSDWEATKQDALKATMSGFKRDLGFLRQFADIGDMGRGSGFVMTDQQRAYLDRQIAFIDGCNDEELVDLVRSYTDQVLGQRYADSDTEHYTNFPEERFGEQQLVNMMVSRMSPETATALFRSLADEQEPLQKQAEKYELSAEGRIRYEGTRDILSAIHNFGSSHALRTEAGKRADKRAARLDLDASGSEEQVLEKFILQGWAKDADEPRSLWVHAALAKAFSGQDTVDVYWNAKAFGVRLSDPDPALVKALRGLYNLTQQRLASGPQEYELFRGVNAPISTRSHGESWTTDNFVAATFGHFEVMQAIVPRRAILGTFATIPGWDEASVIGKNEFIVIPRLIEGGQP